MNVTVASTDASAPDAAADANSGPCSTAMMNRIGPATIGRPASHPAMDGPQRRPASHSSQTKPGTSSSFSPANSFASATPLCGSSAACTGYLRLRSRDNVNNEAEDWTTGFVLRYDNAPPTVDFTINGGVTQTTQTLITLDITAADAGSGVQEMRISGDGAAWTPWETYATQRPWTIPGISRQWWPVYVQVRDGVSSRARVIAAPAGL